MRLDRRTWFAALVVLPFALPGDAQIKPSDYDAAIQTNGLDAQAYFQRGIAYARAGDSEHALADLKQSIELDPNRFEIYKALDDLLSSQRKFSTIVEYWTRYIQLHPNDGRAYCERGGAYSYLRDAARARADAEKSCNLGDATCCQVLGTYGGNQAAARAPGGATSETNSSLWVPILAAVMTFVPVIILILVYIVGGIRRRREAKAQTPELVKAALDAWRPPRELTIPVPRPVQLSTLKALRFFLDASVLLVLALLYLSVLVLQHPAHFVREVAIALGLGAAGIWLTSRRFPLFTLCKDLMQNGTATKGLITYCREQSVRTRGSSIQYDFSPPNSLETLSTYLENPPGGLQSGMLTGKVVTVLVDPRFPRRNIPYPFCPFKIVT